MKRLTSIAALITASLLFFACGNNPQKRIVSETPIKTEVLGLKLCDVTSERAIEKAISKAVDKMVVTDTQKNGVETVVRAFPMSFDINYGGLSWTYADVTLNEDKKIVQISLVASYENIERAKEQYAAATRVFTQKYGQGNSNEEYQNIFWTDDTNSVGLTYVESSAVNGNDRSFCTLYYVNRELAHALEEANTPDI